MTRLSPPPETLELLIIQTLAGAAAVAFRSTRYSPMKRRCFDVSLVMAQHLAGISCNLLCPWIYILFRERVEEQTIRLFREL